VAAYGAFGIPYPNLCPTYQPDSRPPPTRYVQPMTRHAGPFASTPYNDNGGWKNNNGNMRSVVYELCGIPRHTTSKCYKRSHRDFLEVGNNGRNAKKQIAMVPKVAIDSTFYGGQTTSRLVDPMWYADSSATHPSRMGSTSSPRGNPTIAPSIFTWQTVHVCTFII
jgi:hypothetical protein